jgi:large subunit ribosomal protein L25
MTIKFELTGEKRADKGTSANRRLRRAGKVPAVLYGGAKDAIMVTFDHDTVYHQLNVKVGSDTDQAILRDVQMHPYRPRVIHMDLQRISAAEKLHLEVPIHVLGEDMAPGVKQEGGVVSRLMTAVDISCLPHQLPEYLDVDISELNIGEYVYLTDIKLPEGVTITSLVHGGEDLPVVSVAAIRVVEEEEVVAEGEELPEGEAPPEGEETTPAAEESEE